jgi:glutaredoxin
MPSNQPDRASAAAIPDVVVYTRNGCHLCDVACTALLRHGLAPRLIDIDESEQLKARYNDWVPVVVINGKVRFRGRVDERLLRRLLAAE